MKKLIAIVLSLVLLLMTATSLAAGKLSTEKENFYALNAYSDYAYAFAKVKNVGNKPIKINAGILEVFDADGENITSNDYLYSYAENLEPDEYTYVYINAKLEDGQLEKVDDYLLTITGKSDSDKSTKRLTVQDTSFQRDVQVGKYSKNNYAYFTVVNDTDETIWDIHVVYALLDDDDNILFVEGDYIGNDTGLTAGSSLQFRMDVSDKWMEYYDSKNIVPSKIDVIAYVDVEN